tara:strand:+ start:514 stop:780 length:267 start_codon:yes stop_codon:yes gene_type:complete
MWEDILKGKRINSKAIPIIDKIMSDGKERTSRNIVDSIFNYIENYNEGKGYRMTFQIVPSTSSIAKYLSSSPKYIKLNNSYIRNFKVE